jgi:hypothetical protein
MNADCGAGECDGSDADSPAVQDAWPELTCFGCGPSNPVGHRLKSRLSADETSIVAVFDPKPEHNSGAPNVMYGGLVASLVDCNSIWAAMVFRNLADGRSHLDPPATAYVTGELSVKYVAPTPLDRPVRVESWVEGDVGRRTRVVTELGPVADDASATTGGSGDDEDFEVTARGDVDAVAVDGFAPGDRRSEAEPTP